MFFLLYLHTITEILISGMGLIYLILRHRIINQVTFNFKSALIKFSTVSISNIILGHGKRAFGTMRAIATPLSSLKNKPK